LRSSGIVSSSFLKSWRVRIFFGFTVGFGVRFFRKLRYAS